MQKKKIEKIKAYITLYMAWRRHDGCHFVSFVMYISGAKFEEHCFNISGDSLFSILPF